MGPRPETGEVYPPEPVPVDGKTTWGLETLRSYESIAYNLQAPRKWPGKEELPNEEVEAIRDRLVAEIDGMADRDYPPFAYMYDYEIAMQAGDRMLIPREGWLEDYRAWQKATFGYEPPKGEGP
ncbi:MAG: hypothetical protein M2R45_01281 [Verrucomicrobia subdivision 3 bacterium]|nr:hypothetical protein [Limisphaerales bacterium]MCS1415147.1 hypothetical protein [Limisphaerales bacterium]